MKKIFKTLALAALMLVTGSISAQPLPWSNGKLKVSDNGRYLCYENGTPFFWLGDTGWLLGMRLNREEAEHYLQVRKEQGYNVVQIMVVNGFPVLNAYGKYSFTDFDSFDNIDKPGEYGYWNHIDYIVDAAARKGIFIAMVPTWGGPVKSGVFNKEGIEKYAKFLAERYKDKPNIIWLNGGDVNAAPNLEEWHLMGNTIKKYDPNHLMTFHPLGRLSSIEWFHNAPWLDFNMFQSGHRRYGQMLKRDKDNVYEGKNQEEDNWRYVDAGLAMKPMKPIIDGEPSYEGIPQGLHDVDEPMWGASDVRRYAYWSVFAGSFGHTYGHSAVMQMHKPGYGGGYGNTANWFDAIYDPGVQQLHHLKDLMLALPYFDRVPDQSVIIGNNGEKYDRIIATRGKDYILAYTYNGCDLNIDMTKISGATKDAWWMNPSTGEKTYIGNFKDGKGRFVPAGRYHVGNDWVLIITDASTSYFKK